MRASERRGKPFYGPDAPNWNFAWLVKATIGKLLLAVYRTRVVGIENLPEGGYILSGNHVSYMDPALLWCVKYAKQPHFIAKSELFRIDLIAWFLDHFGAMPVERGTADRLMITRATDLLKRDEVVAIFPEGTRVRGNDHESLGEAAGGVSFIALRANVPVVPVGIAGTDEIMPPGTRIPRFPRVTISIGEPIYPEQFEGGRKEVVEKMTAEVMTRIHEQRNDARHRA